jgi:flagellar basal-body rod protein FlgB
VKLKERRSVIDDVTTDALHTALDGLAMRQRVIADNVANIETPGFLAGRVNFEDALRSAVADGTPAADVAPTVSRSLEPTRTDGNNVNLDEEEVISTQTGLQYQLALNALDSKYSLLRTALRTS